jgi:hypothetical protein
MGAATAMSTDSLLSPNPDLLFISDAIRVLDGTELEFPDAQLIRAPISSSGEKVKGPAVLGTRDAGAQDDPKVFNVKGGAVGERIG